MAQEYSNVRIMGQLVDSVSQEELVSASVLLLQPADSVMTAFSISNSQGEFALRRVKPGNYLFQVTYVGYKSISRQLSVDNSSNELDMGLVVMQPLTEMLEQATIVDQRIPVRIKKDTIIYNADAFKTQPNDVVEDLLKKMPGIEVDQDGTITAEGEEVEQVLVDGKEFFGRDPKIATKNLPARAIKEVQVFDKKSEAAQFTGIDDGIRSKTINLKLKEDFKKGIFGNITGGYGTEERYRADFNLNSFNKTNQLSALGQLNNINEQGFSVNDYINFMGGMGNLMRRGGVRINSNNTSIPIARGLSDGDTRTGGIGFNVNRSFSKRTKLNATYFYSNLDNFTETQTTRNYFQNRGNFKTDENELLNSKNNSHRISSRLDHEIDSMQSIRLTARYTLNDLTYLSNLDAETLDDSFVRQNESLIDNAVSGMNHNLQTDFTYRKKFNKKGRSIIAELSYDFAPEEQEANLRSVNTFYDRQGVSTDSLYQDQLENSAEQSGVASATWTEPLGGRKYLGLTYSFTQIDNDADQDVYDLDPDNNRQINIELTNDYDQRTQFHRSEAAFRWLFEKSNLNVRLGWQRSLLDGEISLGNTFISQQYDHLLPSVNWNYDFSRTRSVQLNYRTTVNQPTLYQLQPIIDNSDPLNIYVGNPNLVPEYRHRIQLRVRNFSQFANTSLFANVSLTITENNIVNATSIDDKFIRTTTPVNIDQSIQLSSWVNFGAPLRFIDTRLSLNTSFSYSDGITFINGIENQTDRWRPRFSVSLENIKKEVLDWSLGMDYSYSQTTYSEQKSNNQNYSNQTYWADATATIGTWALQSGIDVDIYGDNFSDDNQTLPIWRASVSKYVIGTKGELKITAFDILNKNQGFQQNIDLNYIEESRSNTIGQYFMLSCTYQIGSFKRNAVQMTGPGRRIRN